MLQSRAGPVGFTSLQMVKVESPGSCMPCSHLPLAVCASRAGGRGQRRHRQGLVCWDSRAL